MQSQSTTANEIVQDSELLTRTGVKSSTSLKTNNNKTESLKEIDDELENQQLRAHALPEDEQQDNELNENQIEVRLFFIFFVVIIILNAKNILKGYRVCVIIYLKKYYLLSVRNVIQNFNFSISQFFDYTLRIA